MPHHLQLVAQEFHWLEEAVDLGVKRQREVEVKHVVEAIGRVSHLGAGIGVPHAVYLAGVHAVVERDVGCDVDVLEDVECGIDGHCVAHAVSPVLDKVFVEELVLLGREGVLETS